MKLIWIIILILKLVIPFPQDSLFDNITGCLDGFFKTTEVQGGISSEETEASGGDAYLTDGGDLVIEIPEGEGFGGF